MAPNPVSTYPLAAGEIAAEDERVMVVHPLYAASWGQRPRPDRR